MFEFQASVLFLPKDQEPPPQQQNQSTGGHRSSGGGQRSQSEQRDRLQAVDEAMHSLSHAQRTGGGGGSSHHLHHDQMRTRGPDGEEGGLLDGAYPSEFYDAILEDAIGHTSFQHLLAPEDFHRMNDYIELADAENGTELDEDDLYPDLVCILCQLLIHSLSHSLMI